MAITKEELQSFSATDEGRAVLTEIGFIHGDQHKSIVDETTKGLAENKARLLAEKKQLEEKFKGILPKAEAVDKLSNILKSHEIVLDENGNFNFDTLEDLIVKGKNGGVSGNTEAIQKELAEYKRKHRDLDLDYKSKMSVFEQTGNELKEANEFISDMLIRGELQRELIKEGYQPIIIDSIIPSLINQSGATVEHDPENPKSRRAVTKEGDTIQKFVSLWKDSDVGKALRSASLNTGGGAGHSGGAIGTKSNLQSAYDEAKKGGNFAQQTAILREAGKNGIIINQ